MVTVRTVAVAAMAGVLAWAALPATALAVVDPAATQASEAVAPIVVSTDADVVDPADGMVSLREAVDRANGRAGGDVIDLDGRTVALTLCAGGAENANRSGDLDHTDAGGALTLRHGAISGCGFDRVVDDRSPRGLVVRALTISGGEGGGRGGGVRSRGPVRVDRSQFLDNIANDTGGAIDAPSVEVRHSTFRGNEGYGDAGGGAIHATGPVLLVASTLSDNTASYGVGGGAVVAGSVTVRRSTLWHNGSQDYDWSGHGGAIWSSGDVVLTDSTVSDNRMPVGGGGLYAGGDLTIVRSTVVRNQAPDGANLTVRGRLTVTASVIGEPHGGGGNCHRGGPTTSGGFNLVSVGGRCGLGAGPGDRTARAELGLWPLDDNGGPTVTHLPIGPSLSFIPTSRCGATRDQRGEPRPQGSYCEAGAVEVP